MEELEKLLCQHQTLKDMKDKSPTAWKWLLLTLLEREEAAKQREVDLTVVNLISKGLFTPGDLSRALNQIERSSDEK